MIIVRVLWYTQIVYLFRFFLLDFPFLFNRVNIFLHVQEYYSSAGLGYAGNIGIIEMVEHPRVKHRVSGVAASLIVKI